MPYQGVRDPPENSKSLRFHEYTGGPRLSRPGFAITSFLITPKMWGGGRDFIADMYGKIVDMASSQ